MVIKFYTDEHVHPGIAKALWKNNIDVLTAQQAGMLDVGDDLHLQFATAQGRVMITQDEDFLKLHAKTNHKGIAYAHQRTSMRQIIEGLLLIYKAMTEEEMENHVEYL
jgi:predicted nuclease of predicted toxin-antitoxin system